MTVPAFIEQRRSIRAFRPEPVDRAVLDYASRMRENLLYNIYRMGRSSIERGSKDTWTANPRRDAEIANRMSSADDSTKWASMKGSITFP